MMEEIREKYDRFILLSKDGTDSPSINLIEHFLACIVIIFILFWVSGNNPSAFFSVIEIFSVAVSWALFILIWNTRSRIVNNGFVFLGVSYFFVGLLQLAHILVSTRASLPSDIDTASQIWQSARILEGCSFFIFPWLSFRRIKAGYAFTGFLVLTILILLSIFTFDIFPSCVSESGASTFFARMSQYAVAVLYVLSMLALFRQRNVFDQEAFGLITAAIVFGFLSVVMSAFIQVENGIYGHFDQIFELGSLFFIYLALIRKGIKKPFAVLFREISKAALEIEKSRNHCRTILDNQPDLITLHDLENRIIWANRAVFESTGLPVKKIIGSRCKDIWNQDEETCTDCPVIESIATGHSGSRVTRTPDGEFWQIRTCPIHDEKGDIIQILELREHVTERLMTEERIRLSENNFQKAFDNSSSILMSISDIETGVFFEVNKAFLRATGYEREDLIGRSSLEIGLIDIETRKTMLAGLYGTGKYEAIDIRFRKKNGDVLDTLFSGEEVVIDGKKKMLSIAQDMTEFLKTRAELEKEKSLLQAVFESTRDFFILKDKNSLYQKANPAFCRFMGIKSGQVLGMTDRDFHPEEIVSRLILEDRSVIETGRSSCRDRQYSGESETRWFQVVKTPVIDVSGETTGILCSIRDVSERRQMEELLKARLRISETSVGSSMSEVFRSIIEEAGKLTMSKISFLHTFEYQGDLGTVNQWCFDTCGRIMRTEQRLSVKEMDEKLNLLECVQKRIPVIRNDYLAHPGYVKLLGFNERLMSDLIVPVFEKDRVAAILGVANKGSLYTRSDMDTVTELSSMVWDIITRKRSQIELSESRKKMKTLLDNLPGMAFRCRYDSDWSMEYLSNGCLELTGYDAEEFINTSVFTYNGIIHPEDREVVRSVVVGSFRDFRPYEVEYRIMHKDGSIRWVWEKGAAVRDESGRIVSFEGFLSDMTEKVMAKDMLKEQGNILKTILDGIPDILILMNPDHTIISGNRAAFERLGKKSSEIEGRKCFELFGRTNNCGRCTTSVSLRTGKNASHERYEPVLGRWFHINTIPILTDDGRVSMIVEQLQDITERRENEAELRRLASAVHHVAETIVITDEKGRIKYANPSFEATTGYSPSAALGMNPSILKSGVQDDAFYSDLWSTITSGKTWYGRMVNRKKDGSLYTEDASISPVMDENGKITEFVAVKRDITGELNMEAQLFQAQKMEAIGALAGGIAHDFNNVLFPLMGYGEMLQMDLPEDSFLQDYVLEILRASKRAKALVQQILAFSRQSAIEKTAVRIQSIMNEVIRFTRASLPSTIKVRTSIDKKCRPVLADQTQIHQVAMNLMTNAFHAMEENGGELHISLREIGHEEALTFSSDLPKGFYARLSISDSGCGIDPSIKDKIFNPYFTTKEKGKGTGIGLAVVHGIVKSHGGSITMNSELGKGTTFDIVLPCINDHEMEAMKDQVIPVSGGEEKILVVDDEEPIARMLRQMLERFGYAVTVRTSSTEALQLFRDNPERFDLVITDMTMPGMTGDRLAMELRNIRPDIRIIICTGFSEKINEDIAKSIGIDGYVFKPVLQNELVGMIKAIVDKD